MAKKGNETQKPEAAAEAGEQMDLIDVAPANAKPIIAEARAYEAAKRARLKAGAEETARKEKLLTLIKQANLQRLDDGSIRFKARGFIIKVTPRDELVTVTEEGGKED
jgi:hypothetical protein